MPQTMYNRPYPAWLPLVVCIPLTVLVIVLAVVEGVRSPAPWIVLLAHFLAVAGFVVLAPDCAIKSWRIMPNGTVVLARRPLVGSRGAKERSGSLVTTKMDSTGIGTRRPISGSDWGCKHHTGYNTSSRGREVEDGGRECRNQAAWSKETVRWYPHAI